MQKNLKVNGERLWQSLMEMAEIGATPKGGVCRLALTELDRQARDLLRALVRGGGLHRHRGCHRQHFRAACGQRRQACPRS